ncbi:hypothetical protein Hypma_003805 [Hypsizygus marmoreus]|uniref:Uncharacterized protein n=1 Tax=Hypsizygus marmoreus TaxID=39966 RepID=A0A369K9N3_HYPMA|nr:hypothetical protein Hypma_003805 [Hypsizygus marmoreus]
MRASVIVAFAAIIAAPALAQPAPHAVTLVARASSQKYSLSARDIMEAGVDVLDRRGLLDEPSSIGGGPRRQDRSANKGESFLTGPSILDSPSNTEANRGQRRFAAGRNHSNAHSGNRQRPASGQRPPESSDSNSSSSDSDSSDGSPGEAAQRPEQAQSLRRGPRVRLGAGWRAGTSSAQQGQGPASGRRSTANSRGSGAPAAALATGTRVGLST